MIHYRLSKHGSPALELDGRTVILDRKGRAKPALYVEREKGKLPVAIVPLEIGDRVLRVDETLGHALIRVKGEIVYRMWDGKATGPRCTSVLPSWVLPSEMDKGIREENPNGARFVRHGQRNESVFKTG